MLRCFAGFVRKGGVFSERRKVYSIGGCVGSFWSLAGVEEFSVDEVGWEVGSF